MPSTPRPDDLPGSAQAEDIMSPGPGPRAEQILEELSSSALVEDVEASAAPDDDERSLVGSLLSGRYRVHELIGQGGMGAVYRGEQVHLRKQVAIKLLRPGARRMPELVARFEREAIAGAHIRHPNVVPAIDFGQLDDRSFFLVLEYVEGTPLKDVIAAGPLPPLRALRVARQIASALDAAHEKGIVHRDVKPQNVLLDARDQVKLIDFGLAKVDVELLSSERRNAKPSPALTSAGEIFGTLAYLAPEASRGMEAVDARADLYALGIVLYEMLAGRHPFDGKDAVSRYKHQRSENAPPLRARAPELALPPQVEPMVMRLIERDPALRYPTAASVVAVLDECIAALERSQEQAHAERKAKAAPAWSGPRATLLAYARRIRKRSPGLPRWVVPVVGALGSLSILGVTVWALLRSPAPAEQAPAQAVASEAPAPAPPPPEPAPPPEIDGLDADGHRAALSKAVARRDWILGSRAVLALGQLDPARLVSRGLREEVLSVVAGIGFEEDSKEADQVFDLFTNQLGSDGLDVLLDIVRARGGTRAARRAIEILTRPEVKARATPAHRITLELRRAKCDDKRKLFERAAAEGDERTLFELEILHGARCRRRRDPCCFRDDKAIAEAIQKLKERLGN